MQVREIGGDFVGRGEVLEAEDIDIRQSGFDDFVGEGAGGFIAVAEDEVMLVVAADGIVRGAIPECGECAQFFTAGIGLELLGIKERAFPCTLLGRVNPGRAVDVEVAIVLGSSFMRAQCSRAT